SPSAPGRSRSSSRSSISPSSPGGLPSRSAPWRRAERSGEGGGTWGRFIALQQHGRCAHQVAMFGGSFAASGFLSVVELSLAVSLSAPASACLIGLPLGAVLAMLRFPGRTLLVMLVNALLGLPPVVVGLALYLLLSHSGPLGAFRLLFTPGAMVLAQSVLA